MANTVSALFAMTINATETFDQAVAGNEGLSDTNKTVLHNAFNLSNTISAGTTVPATTVVSWTQALGAGAATVDLNTLTGTNGDVVDLEGLKIQLLMLKAVAANANPITFKFGAANPYNFFGAVFQVVLDPGAQAMFFANDAAPDVTGGAADTFTMSGTGAQELDIILVAG